MKAVVLEQFGGPEHLHLRELPTPAPGEGESLVRIRSAGVNPVDFKIREGRLQGRVPALLPAVLGWDMAGEVVDRGHGARRFEIGDAVYAYCRRPQIHAGCYAEYISLPESYLARKPANLDYSQAAVTPLACLTAYQSLYVAGRLSRNQSLLVLGASGGVGSFAVQLGRMAGARVSAVASAKNQAYLQLLGAHQSIAYDQADWQHLAVAQGRFDVVYDCAGGAAIDAAYELVKPGGVLVSILEQADPARVQAKGIRFEYVFVEPNARQLEVIREHFEYGRLRSPELQALPLEEVRVAHERIQTLHTRGKIALQI